jgi:hypothetical protein
MTVLFSIPMIGKLIDIPAYMNPGRRILGWEEMSESIGEIINEQEGDILLVADSYKTASMLTFYLRGQPVVHSFSPTKRMNQFDLWENRMKTDSNVQTLFIGESETKQLQAFGKKLEHYQVLRPYNDSEGTHYYVILFDAFYGMEGYSKSKY